MYKYLLQVKQLIRFRICISNMPSRHPEEHNPMKSCLHVLKAMFYNHNFFKYKTNCFVFHKPILVQVFPFCKIGSLFLKYSLLMITNCYLWFCMLFSLTSKVQTLYGSTEKLDKEFSSSWKLSSYFIFYNLGLFSFEQVWVQDVCCCFSMILFFSEN